MHHFRKRPSEGPDREVRLRTHKPRRPRARASSTLTQLKLNGTSQSTVPVCVQSWRPSCNPGCPKGFWVACIENRDSQVWRSFWQLCSCRRDARWTDTFCVSLNYFWAPLRCAHLGPKISQSDVIHLSAVPIYHGQLPVPRQICISSQPLSHPVQKYTVPLVASR